MTGSGENAGLVAVLRALGRGVDDVMIVGGWAHRLHALHPLAEETGSPLYTTDADLFVPSPSPALPIRVAELEAAGFEVRLGGLDETPVTKYVMRSGVINTTTIHEIEFIAQRRGAEVVRGRRNITVKVGDAVAQLLPHLDVMSREPWTLQLSEPQFPTGASPITVRVVGPGPYIAHKLIVLPERQNLRKREADVRYLYESFLRFATALDEISIAWQRRRTMRAELKRIAIGRRLAVSRDLLVAAGRIEDLDGRTVTPERMLSVIEDGSARLFDT